MNKGRKNERGRRDMTKRIIRGYHEEKLTREERVQKNREGRKEVEVIMLKTSLREDESGDQGTAYVSL